MWIRLPKFILAWILFMALKFVVAILGLFVVLFMYRHRANDVQAMLEHKPWFTPWLNPEDWTGGPQAHNQTSLPYWWIERCMKEGKSAFYMWWHYHAVRNPANGLRNYEFLDLDIDPTAMGFHTAYYMEHYEPWAMRKNALIPDTVWYMAWQGWQAGFKYVHLWNEERHLVIKIGWRIQPSDKTVAIDPDGIRHEDAGFASKFLPYRKG